MSDSKFDLGLDEDDLRPQEQPKPKGMDALTRQEKDFVRGKWRPRKYRFTIDLEKEIHTELKLFCAHSKKSMADVIRAALRQYIRHPSRKPPTP